MQLNSTLLDDLAYNLYKTKIDKRYIWIEGLYTALKYRTPAEIAFDELEGPSVDMLLSQEEIEEINRLLKKVDWNHSKKFQILDAIFKPKGYKRGDCGTNRVVYIPVWDDRFVVKVALDTAARKNMPDELLNQKYIKPFCCKCFDIDKYGNIGVYERVIPIRNLDQFWSIRDDVYNIIQKLIKRFVIDDFGTNTFMNWGVRKGFGPLLLDYADMYLIDPETLYCKNVTDWTDKTHVKRCGGRIGYTAGYNSLVCLDCGRPAKAAEFKGRPKMAIKAPKRRENIMKFVIYEGDEVVYDKEHGIDKIHHPVDTKTYSQIQLDEVVKETNRQIARVNNLDQEEIRNINISNGLQLNVGNRIDYVNPDEIVKRKKHDTFLSRNEAEFMAYDKDKIKETHREETMIVKPKGKRRRIVMADDTTKPNDEEKVAKQIVEPTIKDSTVVVSKPKRIRVIVPTDEETLDSKKSEQKEVADESVKTQEKEVETVVETANGETFVSEPSKVEIKPTENTLIKEKNIMKDENIETVKTILNNSIDAVIFEQEHGTPFDITELDKFFKVLNNTPNFETPVKLTSFIPEVFLCSYALNNGELDENNLSNIYITKKQYDAIKPSVDKLYNTLNDIKIGIEEDMYNDDYNGNFEVIRRRNNNDSNY